MASLPNGGCITSDRLCTNCKSVWNQAILGRICPICGNAADNTFNADDMSSTVYCQQTGENLANYAPVSPFGDQSLYRQRQLK